MIGKEDRRMLLPIVVLPVDQVYLLLADALVEYDEHQHPLTIGLFADPEAGHGRECSVMLPVASASLQSSPDSLFILEHRQ